MKKIFVANWKENPRTEREAMQLFDATAMAARGAKNVTTVVCPPFIYIEKMGKRVGRSRFLLGAQDVSFEERGAHTGEVGPKMLKRLGARYVIIGHSERRAMGEMDVTVNKKIKAALVDGLKVILCVGERAAIRKKGIAAAKRFVAAQLKKDLKGISAARLLIAYEPIWAIGTGKNDSPEDAREMAIFIKKEIDHIFHVPRATCHVPILYGGSVNSKNIGDYVQYKEIDGALVGGASVKKDEVKKMIAVVGGNKSK